MARNSEDNHEYTISPDGEGRRRFKAALSTTGILIIIALVFGWFAVRTETFRLRLQEHIEKRTGEVVTIEKTRIGFPYDLVIEGLESRPAMYEELASVKVASIRIGLSFSLRLRVTVEGARLSLFRLEDGGWKPHCMARLGDVRDVRDVAVLTEDMRDRMDLTVKSSSLLWFDADGSSIAGVQDMDFDMERVSLKGGRKLYHCMMRAYDVEYADGIRQRDVRRQWIFTEDNQFIELKHSEREGEPVLDEQLPVTEGEAE